MSTVEATTIEPVASEPEANKLFRMVMKHKGSDLHLKVGLPPCMRLGGVLRQMALPVLTAAEMERLMYPIMTPRSISRCASGLIVISDDEVMPLVTSASSGRAVIALVASCAVWVS